MSEETLWIFGYGSLVWRPAFPHLRARPAWITGFSRRFWQGSTDHRGVPGAPGRVVTLVAEDPLVPRPGDSAHVGNEPCWGTAYEVPLSDPEGVLERLDDRERGGYDRLSIPISIRHTTDRTVETSGVVYIAGPQNENFLGPAPVEEIAAQVAAAQGPSGPNGEYVFELAQSLRRMGAFDAHVFAVDAALRDLTGWGP